MVRCYGEQLLAPRPTAVGPPLVCCLQLLIQYIRGYTPYCRPFLHPQPEGALCRGDRDPLVTAESISKPNSPLVNLSAPEIQIILHSCNHPVPLLALRSKLAALISGNSVTGHEIGTVGRMTHNLPVVEP